MAFLSSRVPAVVWSGILAFVLTVVAGGVWTVLLISNIATSPAIPWAVIVMALLLWLMWQYLGGEWGPRSTSQARRRYRRARPLPGQVFAWAVVAGVLSIVALVGYWIMLVQLVKNTARVLPNFSGAPLLTVALVLVMASLVSSLAEEVGFRGYFQGILEQPGEWPGRHRTCGSGDCSGPRSDAGVRVASPAVVLVRRCDVRSDGLLHPVDSAGHCGSQPWPTYLLHPGVAL